MPVVAICAAYCIGSVPFAWLLARRWGAPDLRRVGSGNLGAANVLRASGVAAGLLVAALDVTKGAASVILAARLGESSASLAAAGLAAIVGHIYPVWLRFRGGKGVATACGVFWVLTPLAALPALAIFIATVWLTKYVSLGSVVASLALPAIAYATGSPASVVVVACAACALIIFRHRSNVVRLRTGTEHRLGARASACGPRGSTGSPRPERVEGREVSESAPVARVNDDRRSAGASESLQPKALGVGPQRQKKCGAPRA